MKTLAVGIQGYVPETTFLYVLIAVLLVLCTVSLTTNALLVTLLTKSRIKNDSLFELLMSESERHMSVVLSLNDRLNNQYYMHQEKVSIEHIATLRELLSSFSPPPNLEVEVPASERPEDSSG